MALPMRFTLDTACAFEQARRLMELGDLTQKPYDYARFRKRSRETLIPIKVLKSWHSAYSLHGPGGLRPTDWTELSDEDWAAALARRAQLGGLADAETITDVQIHELANKLKKSYRNTRRWVDRYRVYGLWALAPGNDPDKPRQALAHKSVVASAAALKEASEKLAILGDLADKRPVTQKDMNARLAELHAQGIDIKERALWDLLRAYRESGFEGLPTKQRSDTGKNHGISDEFREIIEGIRLSHKDYKPKDVWKAARDLAKKRGEPIPSKRQIRDICRSIPAEAKVLADERESDYASDLEITYPRPIPVGRIVLELDETPIDMLVKDTRKPPFRNESGEVRPHLQACVARNGLPLMAARFTFDDVNRFDTGATIRDALLTSPRTPCGGRPDEIIVDHAPADTAEYIKEVAREVRFRLHICHKGKPKEKPNIERFFEVVNDELWSHLDGYIGSNTTERNPKAKAVLTLDQLEAKFWDWVATEYHVEPQARTGESPLEYWDRHVFAEPVDADILDTLLLEPVERKVTKRGISYGGRTYWHQDLSLVPVHQKVLVRAEPSYRIPDTILVYRWDGEKGKWAKLCEAFAIDSERGQAVTATEVKQAQRAQRKRARRYIAEKRTALERAEEELAAEPGVAPAADAAGAPPSAPEQASPPAKPAHKATTRKPDMLDRRIARRKLQGHKKDPE